MTIERKTVYTDDGKLWGVKVFCANCGADRLQFPEKGTLLQIPAIGPSILDVADAAAETHERFFKGSHLITIFEWRPY